MSGVDLEMFSIKVLPGFDMSGSGRVYTRILPLYGFSTVTVYPFSVLTDIDAPVPTAGTISVAVFLSVPKDVLLLSHSVT